MKKAVLLCTAVLLLTTVVGIAIMKRSRTVKADDPPSPSQSPPFPRWKTGAYKDFTGKSSLRSEIFAKWGLCGYVEQVSTSGADHYVLFLVNRRGDSEESSSASKDLVFVNGFDSLEAARKSAEESCATQ